MLDTRCSISPSLWDEMRKNRSKSSSQNIGGLRNVSRYRIKHKMKVPFDIGCVPLKIMLLSIKILDSRSCHVIIEARLFSTY